jgi:hypothetical protein
VPVKANRALRACQSLSERDENRHSPSEPMRARRSSLELAIQKISVIMDGPADWDGWIEIVKTLVLASKVWDYVDLSEDEIPALEEPRSSQPKNVNAQASIFGQLSREKREKYRVLTQDYKRQRDLYDRRGNALVSLRTSIQSSVSKTFGISNAREMITELQKRLRPTDQFRELELTREYQKLKMAPENQDLDN